jgi:hypothetical protein
MSFTPGEKPVALIKLLNLVVFHCETKCILQCDTYFFINMIIESQWSLQFDQHVISGNSGQYEMASIWNIRKNNQYSSVPLSPSSIGPNVMHFPLRNTNQYKICKFCWGISSSFHNISQPNFAILLILRSSI